MSDTKNLGYIQPSRTQGLPPVKIPRRFQNRIFTSYSDIEKNDGNNGVLECKALQDVTVRGRLVKAGEVFKTGANDVIRMAHARDVEIIDDKMQEEERVVAEAKRLGLNQPATLEATDFPVPVPERERKSWAKGVAA